MKLNKLTIENLKGIKHFEFCPDGENATITGQNGAGKTSVYDAYLWLLFGKDSTGRTDFEIRPLDKNNRRIKGLVLAVEAELEINGETYVLRKEQHEKLVRKQITGFEAKCWVDQVPKKVGEYAEFIASIIPEETFKMLADLHYFNDKLHWRNRRSVLLEIAGKIDKPAGFEDLIAKIKNRTIDEYKKVLAEEKKRHVAEQAEINPRIDEIQKAYDTYVDFDSADIEKKRNAATVALGELDEERKTLLAGEKARQKKIGDLNKKKADKITREAQLKNETTNVNKYIDEKNKLVLAVSKKKGVVTMLDMDIKGRQAEIDAEKRNLDCFMRARTDISDEYKKLERPDEDIRCTLCGQTITPEMIAEITEKRFLRKKEIVRQGKVIMGKLKDGESDIDAKQEELLEIKKKLEYINIEVAEAEKYKEDRGAELDKLIKADIKVEPGQDAYWLVICEGIKRLEKEIGESVADKMDDLDTLRSEKAKALSEYNEVLAGKDRMVRDKARIVELEAKEKELAQQIADIDGISEQIGLYTEAESAIVEVAVNSRFKYVTFKLFETKMNENIEPTCVALDNGVPYKDMSYGQKIRVGLDIINVLSKHYKMSVPIFVDNSESLTYPIEADTQVIKLAALDMDIKGREKNKLVLAVSKKKGVVTMESVKEITAMFV